MNEIKKHVANFVTILRVLLCALSALMIFEKNWLGIALLPIVFILDLVDGYAARNLGSKEYGIRIDVAGDRIVEYLYYFLYSILGLFPYFILPIIFIRNSFVDALFYTKERNFSTAKTAAARIFSSSKISRGLFGISKFALFFYFAFVFMYNAPLMPGYFLLALVVGFSVIRGISDIYEVIK
jgi:phosphatidylglycerophosphate synthase